MPTDRDARDAVLYEGLKALAETSFPKRCNSCGRVFAVPSDFVAETVRVGSGASGLKQGQEDDGRRVVELYRNCPCGSTLMGAFDDRRTLSEPAARRRERFDELLELLERRGVPRAEAREELLKVVHGEPSEKLWHLTDPDRPTVF